MAEVVGLVWIRRRDGTVIADWQVINPDPIEQFFLVEIDDHAKIKIAGTSYGPLRGDTVHSITVTPVNNQRGGDSLTYTPKEAKT